MQREAIDERFGPASLTAGNSWQPQSDGAVLGAELGRLTSRIHESRVSNDRPSVGTSGKTFEISGQRQLRRTKPPAGESCDASNYRAGQDLKGFWRDNHQPPTTSVSHERALGQAFMIFIAAVRPAH
jgi:hypothetical protein